ncbi:RNA polymerase sigma factor [Reticulibacter mediterranei]|uniref:RNA polymerase sigma factor n=1 Tax=Reticulibacter mediterranei TaxID=2778369 RepID=A0A8J3N2V8_9CHLR|nr:RNA polymerase sigma factor [Reticulibacter mediterranei]GHO96474.1 RNA polymerase sigma factor [Reticulibacter mediterranei]
MNHHIQRSHYGNLSHTLVDQVLTEQALAGDQAAFEVLINKYESPLRGYIWRILKDHDLMADVLQHVFLQCYCSLPKLRTDTPLKAWLFRVAYHRCLDELRSKRRRQAISFSQLEGEDGEEASPLADELLDPDLTPEELLEQQELHEQVVQAMETLSPRLRAVVHLRSFGELSFAEIGKQLNMPESTAKTYFHRSLPRLRAAFVARRENLSKNQLMSNGLFASSSGHIGK